MQVGVIGSGNIGGALARAWRTFGALDSVLAELGDLAGKIVVDCTNPMKDTRAEGSGRFAPRSPSPLERWIDGGAPE